MKKGANYDISFSFAQISKNPLQREGLSCSSFEPSSTHHADVRPQLSQAYAAKTSEIAGLDASIEEVWAKKLYHEISRIHIVSYIANILAPKKERDFGMGSSFELGKSHQPQVLKYHLVIHFNKYKILSCFYRFES
jgi:hypothetical protein